MIATIEKTPLPPKELELFKELKDLKVIFDVGARTDIEYLEVWPESEFHLFEPNPIFCENLIEKVQGKSNVFVNCFGLGDREDKIKYQIGLESFIESVNINDPYAKGDLILPIKTLDSYIKEHNIRRIDFLKIDTEGFEIKVLNGAKDWFDIIKFIQYEHWGEGNMKFINNMLSDKFECIYVGFRNVLCINKNLVPEEEKARLRKLIEERGYAHCEGWC